MTDGGAVLQPDQEEPALPFRARSEYADYEVFGSGPDAVFVFPRTARELRSAAEFATQERRIAGGLLFGRGWRDDEGPYLVISGYLEAGPGENRGDKIGPDGYDNFTLSTADLRLLQDDAARQYPSDLEVGWWRSLAAPGEFSPRDYLTQRDLIGPGGVGLLVFGSGLGWGDAYLGPDGHAPGLGEPVVPGQRPAPEPEPGPAAADLADPEPAAEVAPGPPAGPRDPVLTPAPQPAGPRAVSPIRVPAQEWGTKPVNPGLVGPRMPTDVKLVTGALILAAIAVAIILGMLLSNAWVGVIALVVGLLVIFGFIYITHI
jgi:hypothetical protein